MGRHSLRLTIVLGVIITALGSTGIFAAFTDRASTGTNSAETGSRPAAADVVISKAALAEGYVDCDADNDGAFSNQLVTGIFSSTGIQPTEYSDAEIAYVCVQNAGSATIEVEATITDIVDIDTACTGDEAASGDASCGNSGPGELSGAIAVQMEQLDCGSAASTPIQSNSIANWPAAPAPLSGALAPGDIACIAFHLWVPASSGETVLQVAQSDLVEWRFAFDAALPS